MSPDQINGKSVLVTGGAGFIGSELVDQLSRQALSRLVVVDDLTNGSIENIRPALARGAEFRRVDIRDGKAMSEIMAGVDVVYHLACLGVRHSIHSPEENASVNSAGTLSVLEAARLAGVSRFVYVSSSEVYGTAECVPMTERHPTNPMTVYGAGKLAGELYTHAYRRTYSLPTVVVRPFNSFGPRSHHEGDCGEVIPKFVLRALAGEPLVVFGDGSQTRDFTYVEDTARGILSAGVADGVCGHTINLGHGDEITIRALADLVADVVGCPTQVVHHDPRPGDVLRLYSDSSLARRLLGFEPRVTLREGLSRLVEWYRTQDVSPTDLLRSEAVENWRKS